MFYLKININSTLNFFLIKGTTKSWEKNVIAGTQKFILFYIRFSFLFFYLQIGKMIINHFVFGYFVFCI